MVRLALVASGDYLLLEGIATSGLYQVLGQLEGRRGWDSPRRLRVQNTEHNARLLLSLKGIVDKRETDKPRAASREPSTYVSKTTAYPHQEKAMKHLRKVKHGALFMEQGTGKTKCILDHAGELFLSGEITGLLVVTKKGVHRQWIESEAPAHLGISFRGQYWPIKIIGDPVDDLDILAINYDGLKTKKGREIVSLFVKRHQNRLLIAADESQDIKNKRSQRWSAMKDIAPYASHRVLATGTPIAKDLTDEWAQLHWLDETILGIRYVTTFRNEYCVMGGFEGRQVVGHRNIEKFKSLTEPYVFRATKDQIGILPKAYAKWSFDLTPQQRSMIKDVKEQLETLVGQGKLISVANAAVSMSKIQQIAAGFVLDENETAHEIMPLDKNPRVQAALEWLAADDEEGKAILWIRYKHEASLICQALEAAGISHAAYHGDVSDANKRSALANFLAPDGVRCLVAHPASAGTGLNLQIGGCRRALYVTNSFAAIDRWQSEDRIHRIGTTGAVVYTDLIATGSIDRYVLRNLRAKKSLSDYVLDDVAAMLSEM